MEYVWYMENTPVGTLGLVEADGALTELFFGMRAKAPDAACRRKKNPLLAEVERQLCEYFAGMRREFALPLNPRGTPYMRKVWDALSTIPYAQTRTYGQIAAQTGNSKAARAVGLANNRNPIAIILPCHRVVGANGSLVGYAGGLAVKERLLQLERSNV